MQIAYILIPTAVFVAVFILLSKSAKEANEAARKAQSFHNDNNYLS